MNAKVAQACAEEGEDGLSNLSNCILCHILSFLPTKFAAVTSVLSARWRYLFLYLPNIDLDDSLLLYPDRHGDEREIKYSRQMNFVDFANRLFMVYKANSVTEFRLKCPQSDGINAQLSSYISAVLSRNVRYLDVCVWRRKGTLPREMQDCKTLTVLKLLGVGVRDPKLVCLSNLKILHLEDLSIGYNNARARGFRNWTFTIDCPVLEDLRMVDVDLCDNPLLKISNLSLRKLVLLALNADRVVINTPNLEYIEYSGNVPRLTCEFKSLIGVKFSHPGYNDPRLWCYVPSVLDFIAGLSNVKFLSLLKGSFQDFYVENLSNLLPEFPNLTHLELSGESDSCWRKLDILLRHTPNLEILLVDMARSNVAKIIKLWSASSDHTAKETEPQCLLQNVREIKMINFRGHDFEFEILEYFLQHGAVLEMMYVCAAKEGVLKGWPSLIHEKLSKFPRCSKTCEIVLM